MARVEIEPRVLKGFRDLLPPLAMARRQMIRTIEDVFVSFGFSPIDTPALEYADILLGKGSDETDRQLYRFEDQGKRDVALRFDLTVPLARYIAMHNNDVGTPFKRYHISPVWRAEKPQRGRYREFIQCDFDIVGTTSLTADAEIISVINKTLSALNIGHKIRINHRLILNGLLDTLGAVGTAQAVLRAIDKLEKLGEEVVSKELESEAGLSAEKIDRVFSFLKLSMEAGSSAELFSELKSFLSDSERGLEGLLQLEKVFEILSSIGIVDTVCGVDLSIARGLDYYTGVVFETTLDELPGIGSVCSGGRYDNLAALYSKREFPGVGSSVGLDRLLAAYEELGRLSKECSNARALVTVLDKDTEAKALELAANLREAGVSIELYPGPAKLGAQLKYADKRGVPFVVIAGEKEFEQGAFNLKDLKSGEQKDGLSIDELFNCLRD